MKKIIAWVLTLAMVAAVSIGATLAYLTDTDEDVNVMTLGKVKIQQLEYERIDDETKDANAKVQQFRDNKPLYPGVYESGFDFGTDGSSVNWDQIGKEGYSSGIWNPDEINNELDKMVFVKNKGDYDAYVRSVFAFEAGNYETVEDYLDSVHLNLNETDWTWEWLDAPVSIGESSYFVATATYNKVLAPGALTEISLSQIALDKTATNEEVKAFGDTYHILVKSQAIQADGFTDSGFALSEGFGSITKNNVPFETDQPIQGIDISTALHYLNGNASGTKITGKVTKLVFGLNENYPNVVDNYTGKLVTEGQDAEVYAYYVPNGSNYEVYLLADSKIIAPASCNGLMQNMSALTEVDASNLDTSKVDNMDYMFAYCSQLTQLDLSSWDVSNVTKMLGTFGMCYKLKTVDVTGWDTSSLTTSRMMFYRNYALEELKGSGQWNLSNNKSIYYMFQECSALKEIDVSGWNCSSVTNMEGVFFKCEDLQTVKGMENWDTSKVKKMAYMFQYCYDLKNVNVSNFKTGNVETMQCMFFGCQSLSEIDVANWNTGKVKTFTSMFSGSGHNDSEMIFTKLEVENWDVSSAVDMNCMFYGCGQLTELDLSKWNTSNVQNLRHTFADCSKLKKINFSGWDTSNVWNFDGMFNDCTALMELDLSDFDTGNATTFHQFFEGCGSLITVKGMENWDTSKVTDMSQMFNTNGKTMHLEYVDLSAFNTESLTSTSSMFNGCHKLATVYVGDDWDMSKVTSSGSMFGGCYALVGGNGTTTADKPADVTHACVDTTETPGFLTYKAPVGAETAP